jgi:ABC-type sugar transport system permease subunit
VTVSGAGSGGSTPSGPPAPDTTPEKGATGSPGPWRARAAWIMVALALVLTLISSLTVWLERQALDTDAWTQTSVELLEDDQTRAALSTYIVNQVFTGERLPAFRERLPEPLAPLAAPLAAGLEDIARRTTDRLLSTPAFQTVWEQANRRAHTRLVAILEEKDTGAIESGEGEVVLDLTPLVQRVRDRVGIENPRNPDAGKIVVMSSDQLATAQDAVRAIRAVSVFAVLVVIALLAGAFALGDGRRRLLLLATGAGLLIVGILLLAIRRIAGDTLIDELATNPTVKPSAEHAWLLGTSLLRDLAVGLMVIGVVAAAGAWLAGPSRHATAARRVMAPLFVNPWAVHAVVIAIVAAVLAWSPLGTGRGLWGTLALAAGVIAGVEVLRRRTLDEFPPAAPPAPTPPREDPA